MVSIQDFVLELTRLKRLGKALKISSKYGDFYTRVDDDIYHEFKGKVYLRVKTKKNVKGEVHTLYYVVTSKGYLHRIVANAPQGYEVDHIDRNTLNNRRDNLRICTRQENSRNKTKQSNNTSGHKGVSWDKAKKKWRAFISVDRKQIFLGRYNTIEEAIEARKQADTKYFKDFKYIGE